MNNTLGIEYAYARIHKLEVEALAYKDKIAELESDQKILECYVVGLEKTIHIYQTKGGAE